MGSLQGMYYLQTISIPLFYQHYLSLCIVLDFVLLASIDWLNDLFVFDVQLVYVLLQFVEFVMMAGVGVSMAYAVDVSFLISTSILVLCVASVVVDVASVVVVVDDDVVVVDDDDVVVMSSDLLEIIEAAAVFAGA